LADLCGQIPYASAATVGVWRFDGMPCGIRSTVPGFVVRGVENNGILAVSWLSSKWPNRAPPTGSSCARFSAALRDPDALNKSDAEMITAALEAVRPILGIARATRC